MRKLKHKFNAKSVQDKDSGNKFPSVLEYGYFKYLETLKRAKIVSFFLRQVPFHLPGGVRYVVDYQVFYENGDIEFVDVKGMETSEFKMKKKMVEDLYPIEILIVKKGDF